MIIAINQQPYDGPWGGGNRFVKAVTEGLRVAGHTIVHNLDKPVDIILMVETRVRSPNVSFGAGAILRYLIRHPDTLVVHRINECDERKGGKKFITHRLLRANYAADVTVFVASWLMDLPAWKNHNRERCHVILNGADTKTFNAKGAAAWSGQGPIRLVTHHWGAHPFKGFDVYHRIDECLADPVFASQYAMTYIGNLPAGDSFKHIRHIKALDGLALAEEIKSHHVYLTGSICEPGGNHQNEGACCGLPLVYRQSGCLPEYCDGFGISYNGPDDVCTALDSMREAYTVFQSKMTDYPHTASRMVYDWISFFEEIECNKNKIVNGRGSILRSPCRFLMNQIPW